MKWKKQFKAGTKVYYTFLYDGIGNERVFVFSKPRRIF